MRRRGVAQGGPSLFDDAVEAPAPPAAPPALDYAVDPPVPVVGRPALQGVRETLEALPPEPRRAYRGEPGHVYNMNPAERAASLVDMPDRSRWTFEGREVEVRGTSPLMVWFTEPGAPATSQATRYRHEFLKKAVRLT